MVLRALGLGDLLTALPALRALADAFPGHRRVLAAPAALRPLALLSGAVEDLINTAPLAPLDDSLRGADVAVNLHGCGPQSHQVLLGSRCRRLIAFAHPDVPETAEAPRWREDEHEVRRWCRLLAESGIPADRGRLGLSVPEGPLPAGARDATVIHPGGATPARRWPALRWVAVARAEHSAGRRVVVTGSPAERDLACAVARLAGLPDGAVLAGRTDLPTLVRLVAAAGRVVSADTGVAHLATAVSTPSVVLFGPSGPARWGPPEDRPWHRALWAGQAGDPFAVGPDPGLLRITVDEVLSALADLPTAPPRPAVHRVGRWRAHRP